MNRLCRAVSCALAIALLLAAVGCSGDDTGAAGENIDQESAGDLGATVYANSCASCHGAELKGTDKGPSQLSIVYEPNHHPDDAYRSAIANGAAQHHWNFGNMPPVEGLSDDEVDAVIDYIRSEQQRQGFQS